MRERFRCYDWIELINVFLKENQFCFICEWDLTKVALINESGRFSVSICIIRISRKSCRAFTWCSERYTKYTTVIHDLKELKNLVENYLVDVREFRDIKNGGEGKIRICGR